MPKLVDVENIGLIEVPDDMGENELLEFVGTLDQGALPAAGNAFSLERVAVFDVYQGKGLPEGTKSLAFSIVFRSPDRTLTDDEVNAAFNKIQADVVQSTGFSIRK